MTAVGESQLSTQKSPRYRKTLSATAIAVVLSAGLLSACSSTTDVFHNGYVMDEQSLPLIPEGSSREQVLLTMGTPSTTATFGNEVFYYISQKRVRKAAFMKPQLVEQNILAIYFNKDGVIERKANYTLQDGKVFDTISRTTPTGGKDLTFLQQLLSGGTSGANIAKSILGSEANN
ncbi:outer membrane protein assembly factor BamE [Agrobacterium tumefaciens]|uniref:outer membrane protein assembly factor BamE n=1 Tax=Agrobacterium tumefaciens TaxID=358 RepID=UPI00287BE5D4|nr:outer membrane protein assembly factor BamE [Agrobacterium tumefaciens]MDS7596735.1 outer membrane protein assembly factor BamE [Agrobacterium tumefaciens]